MNSIYLGDYHQQPIRWNHLYRSKIVHWILSRRILAPQGIDSPSKATYYRYQKKVNNSIIELVKESMSEEANKMEPGTSISCDEA